MERATAERELLLKTMVPLGNDEATIQRFIATAMAELNVLTVNNGIRYNLKPSDVEVWRKWWR